MNGNASRAASPEPVFVPPIKSQGIKTKLVPWIRLNLPEIVNGTYIEPFMGTGVVGLNLRYPTTLMADANPHLIRFYQALQSGEITAASARAYLEEQGKQLRESPEDGYEYFRTVRNRFNADFAPLDFLFLSRAGFNGMIRFNKQGKWNVPFCKKPDRFAKAYVTKIVNQIKYAAQIISPDWLFVRQSFEKTIEAAGSGDFIYCDPPYAGRYADYYNNWTEADEQLLFESLAAFPGKFMLSTWSHNDYRSNPYLEKYAGNFRVLRRDHFYHSGGKLENRKSVVEALVLNYDPPPRGERLNPAAEPRQARLF